ncbi:MAG: 2-hydroxycyclohexanecarboxyl-CoA dehydrogenase [Alphaproteobacteria bacterium]|nr:2-hydroxycyclohexanecarboxyl-CoA dehydrogenase [Alphaproteobacteria bacterium]
MAGKTALITGAGGGIGAAVARLFCQEGAAVALFDRNAEILNRTAGELESPGTSASLLVCEGDVSNPADAARAVEQAVSRFGALNVLVNNAAIRNHSSVEQSEIDDWQRLMAVNVYGAVNFCKAALPALRAGGNASIVNVSSCYAVAGRGGMPIYDATKAALLSLTRTLAFEESQNGVRTNAVCPGGTLTPFTVGRGVASGRKAEDMQNDRRTDSLLQRWARPEEIAFPVLWLASDESSYMTGATIMVDGGLSIM